jgi:hypothetical protein
MTQCPQSEPGLAHVPGVTLKRKLVSEASRCYEAVIRQQSSVALAGALVRNLVTCRPFSLLAKGFANMVEHNSGTSSNTNLACGRNRGDSLAHAVGSRAVVPQ